MLAGHGVPTGHPACDHREPALCPALCPARRRQADPRTGVPSPPRAGGRRRCIATARRARLPGQVRCEAADRAARLLVPGAVPVAGQLLAGGGGGPVRVPDARHRRPAPRQPTGATHRGVDGAAGRVRGTGRPGRPEAFRPCGSVDNRPRARTRRDARRARSLAQRAFAGVPGRRGDRPACQAGRPATRPGVGRRAATIRDVRRRAARPGRLPRPVPGIGLRQPRPGRQQPVHHGDEVRWPDVRHLRRPGGGGLPQLGRLGAGRRPPGD